jgi:hypothetical protein
MPDTDTNAAIEATPLPETFLEDQDVAGFKTVEELVADYKATKTKASSIGSIDTISEDVRKDPNIAKYKNIDELAKGHLETVKLVGRKGVIIPGENATQEEKDKFLNSLGRPEKPEGYKFTPIDKLHPEIQITPESENVFRGVAHKLGLTQAQTDNLNNWYLGAMSAMLNQRDEKAVNETKAAETALRQEYGGEYEQNINLAKKLVTKFFGKEGAEAFGDLGRKPSVLKGLVALGKKMSEDAVNHGELSDLTTTTVDAKKKIEQITEEILKTDSNDKNYRKLLKERDALYEIAYPSEAKQ